MKKVVIGLIAIFIAITFFIWLPVSVDKGYNPLKETEILEFENSWEYSDNLGNSEVIQLPAKMTWDEVVTEISIKNILSENIMSGSVLKFKSACQAVEIYIDGELRLSFGDKDADVFQFLFINATHHMVVPLNIADAGKEVEIKLFGIPEYTKELQLIRNVELGSHTDFVIQSFFDNLFAISVGFISAVTILLFITMWIVFKLYKKKLSPLFAIGYALWIFFTLNGISIIWPILDYSQEYAVYSKMLFYIIDMIMPIITYIMIHLCDRNIFKGKYNIIPAIHVFLYCLFILLHGFGILAFNYGRPVMMSYSAVAYIILAIYIHKKTPKERKPFIYSILILILGYFLDYIKHLLLLIPINDEIVMWLTFNVSYTFFLNFTLGICSLSCIFFVIKVLVNAEHNTKTEMAVAKFQTEMYMKNYDKTMEHLMYTKKMKHDMVHQIRTIANLTGQEKTEYAQNIIEDLEHSSNITFTKHHILNITLAWFYQEASEKGTKFNVLCDVEENKLEKDTKICGVVSNILQNAIEAVSYVTDERYIDFVIRKTGDMITIKCVNPYNGNILKHGNVIVSSKDENGHGFGLKSVEDFANSTGGMVKVKTENNIFEIDVVLNNIR